MKYCPNCESLLTADMEVYVVSGEVVACEECCTTRYADEYFDEEELLELEESRRDQALWDAGKDARYGL